MYAARLILLMLDFLGDFLAGVAISIASVVSEDFLASEIGILPRGASAFRVDDELIFL